jgi:hypothetical protein
MTAATMSDKPSETKPKGRDGRRRNNLTHGLRCASLGSVPTGASYVGKLMHEFRRQLEACVLKAKGEISFTDACHVNTAARWERHALLTTRWLKLHAETMTHDQRLNYSRDIGRASENRDRSISALKLDRDVSTIMDALYGAPRLAELPSDPPAEGSDHGAS